MLTKFGLNLMNAAGGIFGGGVWFLWICAKCKMYNDSLLGRDNGLMMIMMMMMTIVKFVCCKKHHMPTKTGACGWNWRPVNKKNVKGGFIEHLGHVQIQTFSRTWWQQFLVLEPSFVSLFMQSISKMVKMVLNNNEQDKNKKSWTFGAWTVTTAHQCNMYCIVSYCIWIHVKHWSVKNKQAKAKRYLWSSGQSKPQCLRWHQRLGLAGFLCRRPYHLPLVHSGTSSYLFYVPKIQEECMSLKFHTSLVIKSTATFSNGQQNVNFPAHFLH